MTAITIKDIPKEIHEGLKERARAHGRSLNREVLATLESVLRGSKVDSSSILNHAREVRESTQVYMTQADLDGFKNEGRS